MRQRLLLTELTPMMMRSSSSSSSIKRRRGRQFIFYQSRVDGRSTRQSSTEPSSRREIESEDQHAKVVQSLQEDLILRRVEKIGGRISSMRQKSKDLAKSAGGNFARQVLQAINAKSAASQKGRVWKQRDDKRMTFDIAQVSDEIPLSSSQMERKKKRRKRKKKAKGSYGEEDQPQQHPHQQQQEEDDDKNNFLLIYTPYTRQT